jgi:hypothetical protein
MSIANTTLTSTPAPIISNTVGERAVTVIYLYNGDSTMRTIDLYAVPSGDSPSDGNKFYGALSIEPGDTYILDTEKLLLDNGDTVYGSASADDVVVATVSYTTL